VGGGNDSGEVEPAIATGGTRGRVADRDEPGRVIPLPLPGAQPRAEDLQVGHDDEGTDIKRLRPSPEQEAHEAGEPKGTEHVETIGEKQPMTGVRRSGEQCDSDGEPEPGLDRGAAPQGQRAQVDQAVSGRHEGGHVVQAVDVDLQPRGERVLHRGREEHDDRYLGAHEGGLPAQQREQQHPRAEPQQALLPEVRTAVEQQHQRHPRQRQDDRRVEPSTMQIRGCPCLGHRPEYDWCLWLAGLGSQDGPRGRAGPGAVPAGAAEEVLLPCRSAKG
jgi:hypothetical protein